MNEMIEFCYTYSDERDEDVKRVIIRKQAKDGLNGDTICEAFVDLMESAGFCLDNVYRYFKE